MKKGPSKTVSNVNTAQRKEFAFASKEGLIIVSLILFSIYAFWYKIFEYYYFEKSLTWLIIFPVYSIIVTITILILLITGLLVLWKDRRYIFIHEKFGAGVFLIGILIILTVPIGWINGTFEHVKDIGIYAPNVFPIIVIGSGLCILGSLILARTGGFFIVWLIGITIYLIRSFYAGFSIFIGNSIFGDYDELIGSIVIFVVVISFILFLYHDLKFFYLTRVIKKGNKLRKEKKYSAALKCFNKAIRIYPLFTTAWNNMGNVYYNQGKTAEAVKCYQKALYFNPDYKNAKKNLKVVAGKTQR